MHNNFREIKLYNSLKEALLAAAGIKDFTAHAVSGGDINRAYRLTGDGRTIFMKANRPENLPFFTAETAGLCAIADTGTVRVPEILASGTDEKYGAFLLLEWRRGIPSASFFENFGHRLALMHRADTVRFVNGFGFSSDNYIGASEQENIPEESWVSFFRNHRLAPQFRKAQGWFDSADRKKFSTLLEHLEKYLPEPAFPSLLHGDLWSGNYIAGNDGEAWLIDPAVYVGHFEAELAMTELFGGFPQQFYEAYREVSPIDKEYRERRELYNLYHLLNHLNLFGGGYLESVRQILRLYG